MTRRALLAAALAPVWGQNARPRLSIVWGTGGVPAAFARDAVVFPRAYVSCPDARQAARALECGRFPHAFRDDAVTLWSTFERGANPDDGIAVWTGASGDGKDSPFDRSIR